MPYKFDPENPFTTEKSQPEMAVNTDESRGLNLVDRFHTITQLFLNLVSNTISFFILLLFLSPIETFCTVPSLEDPLVPKFSDISHSRAMILSHQITSN